MSDPDERRHQFDEGRFWRHAKIPAVLALAICFAPQRFAESVIPDYWHLWAEPPSPEDVAAYDAWMKKNGVGWRQRQVEEHLAGVRPAAELRIPDPLRARIIELRQDTDRPDDAAAAVGEMFRHWNKIPRDLQLQGVTECRAASGSKVPNEHDCYPIKEAAVLGDAFRLARLLRSDADAVSPGLPRLPAELALAEQWPNPTVRPAWPAAWKVWQWLFASFAFAGLFNLFVHEERRRSLSPREVRDAKGNVTVAHPAPTESAEPRAFRLWPKSVMGWLVVLASFPGQVIGQILSADLTRLVPRWRERADSLAVLEQCRARLLRLRQEFEQQGRKQELRKIDADLSRINRADADCRRLRIADDAQVALTVVQEEARRIESACEEMETQFGLPSENAPRGLSQARYAVQPPDPPRRR